MAGDEIGQWTVVGSKSKQKNVSKLNGTKEGKNHQNQKSKSVSEGPMERCPTMYTAFLNQDKKYDIPQIKQPKKTSNVKETSKVKETSIQEKKKKSDKKGVQSAVKSTSRESRFDVLSAEVLKQRIDVTKEKFPNAPMLWLKDLCSFLVTNLNAPVKDPVFSKEPQGYPSSMITKEAYDVIANEIKHSLPAIIDIFFHLCFKTIISEKIKGVSNTLGYYFILQCLAQEIPSIISSSLTKYVEELNIYKNRQDISLTILFVCGQAGNNDLDTGFQVWKTLMFPLINSKTCGEYAISYLEKLLASKKCSKVNKGIIEVKDYFTLLDTIFSHDLPVNLQKRLIPLYPKLKNLSYGKEANIVSRNFFPLYLQRLETHCPESLKNEICLSLKQCLLEDSQCFSVWRQIYTKHLAQSRVFIDELKDQWDSFDSEFPRLKLLETLKTFQVTNDELLATGNAANVQSCSSVIDNLIVEMNSNNSKSPSWFFMVLVLVPVIALLAYDIHKHGSFQKELKWRDSEFVVSQSEVATFIIKLKEIDMLYHFSVLKEAGSKTGQLVERVGLKEIGQQAWKKITIYSLKGKKWLDTNVPIFAQLSADFLNPYLESLWKSLMSLGVTVWKSTGGIRLWCSEKLLPLLLVLNDKAPVVYANSVLIAEKCANLCFDLISSTVQIVGQNLPKEEIQKSFQSFVETTQHYIFFIYERIYNQTSFIYAKYM